jgi:hypothetical protein
MGWPITNCVLRHQDRLLQPFEEPPLAAHLISPRRFYTHHGIYVGGGRVIHYAGFSSGFHRGPVEEVSLEEFAKGCIICVRTDPRAFDPSAVVSRARARLGEDDYRLLTNNCLHFCSWCRRGATLNSV